MLSDYFDVDHVEIMVDSQNKIWVNINGVCALRVGYAKHIDLNDYRCKTNDSD